MFPALVNELRSYNHVEIVQMDEVEDWTGMFWRFLACSDLTVSIVLSRDCDSRLNERESTAVAAWLKTGKSFHIMRDHPLHRYIIMGGMWGARAEFLRDINALIADYVKGNYWNIDQEFLGSEIYPRIKNDCVIHDSFTSYSGFSKRRKGLEFVGESFDEFNNPSIEARALLKKEIEKRKTLAWKYQYIRKRSFSVLNRIFPA